MKNRLLVCIGLITALFTVGFVTPGAFLGSSGSPEMITTTFLETSLLIPNFLPICPGGISYGETIECSIVSSETDSYTFSGSAGDRVIVRVQITSGSIDPVLSIDNPLCTSSTIFNLLELACTLTSGGTHTINVSGSVSQTGSYNLHLQRGNNPANQTAIIYGQSLSGDIAIAPEMDVFAFSGNTGDRVIVRMQITSGTLDPNLRIYNPDGSQLCTNNTIFNQLEINCTLIATGSHMIFAYGGDAQTGSYTIHLQRSNNPANQTAIIYGQSLSGDIAIAPEMDVFAFSGNAGDRVIVRMQITSGTLDPNLRIYNPDGSQLCTNNTIFNQLEINCTLIATGSHMIFAYGGDAQTGSYTIHLQRSNSPANQTAIAYGQSLSGDVAVAPEMDVFAFSGNTGDKVILRMQVTSGTLDPNLRIYNPDGSQLCTNNTIFNQLEINCTLIATGSHMIFAYGGDAQTGSYTIHLQRSNNPANQTAIAYGQSLSGDVAVAPEMDVFAFTGKIGSQVIVRMQVTSGTLDPNLRIYNPDGSQLCTSSTIFDLLELNCILVTDGLHMIFAYGGDAQTGSYTITLTKDPTFADVIITYWAWGYIEQLFSVSITGGCATSPLKYCPEDQVTRAQMAVFLEKGLHYPSSYTAPNVAPTFTDTIGHWAKDWIETLKSDGITSGCATGLYCPDNPVTRAQMAIFLLKSKHGVSYAPPPATGVFTDVPVGYWADKWIEQLALEGITGGCATGRYCPDDPVTRAQMAVFLVKTFNLP